MSELISLSYSKDTSSAAETVAFSVIPIKPDGSLDTDAVVSSNIATPLSGTPEDSLKTSVEGAISSYRSAKGI